MSEPTKEGWGTLPVFDIDITARLDAEASLLCELGNWLGGDIDSTLEDARTGFVSTVEHSAPQGHASPSWMALDQEQQTKSIAAWLEWLRDETAADVSPGEILGALCYVVLGAAGLRDDDQSSLAEVVKHNTAVIAERGGLGVILRTFSRLGLRSSEAFLARTCIFSLMTGGSPIGDADMLNLFRSCLDWIEDEEGAVSTNDSRRTSDAIILLDVLLELRCGEASARRELKDTAQRAAGLSRRPKERSLNSTRELVEIREELLAKFPFVKFPRPQALQTGPELDVERIAIDSTTANLRDASVPGGAVTPIPSPLLRPRKTLFQTDPLALFELPLYQHDKVLTPTSVKEGVALLRDAAPETLQDMQCRLERSAGVASSALPQAEDQGRISAYHLALSGAFDFVLPLYGELIGRADGVFAIMFGFAERTLTNLGAMSEHLGAHITDLPHPTNDTDSEVRNWLFDAVDSAHDTQVVLQEQARLHAVIRVWLNLLRACRMSHTLQYECLAAKLWDGDYAKLFSQALLVLNQLHFPAQSLAKSSSYAARILQHTRADKAARPRPQRSMTDGRASARSSIEGSTVDAMHDCIRLANKLVRDYPPRAAMLNSARGWLSMKRCLRVPHRALQDATLKLYKRMVPYTPRKWRQTNMKIITQIYLRCPPRLRDDWMSVVETEGEAAAGFVAREMAMRGLVQQYNLRHFAASVSDLGFQAGFGTDVGQRKVDSLPSDVPSDDDIHDDEIWQRLRDEMEAGDVGVHGDALDGSSFGDAAALSEDFFARELASDGFQL